MSNSKFLPKVSIIIPIFNGEKDLTDLIDCLWNQRYPVDCVEYLLVDNGSQDQTKKLIQQAGIAAMSKNITMYYLTESKIQSSYAARNAGILASQGELLIFTDVDCRPQIDWLFQLVQPFTDLNIGVVGGGIGSLPGETLFEKYAEQEKILSQERHLSNQFLPYLVTANLAVRRKVLEEVGLFRPHLTTGGDADLCWRIQRNSDWQLYYAPQAIVLHRHRTSLIGLLKQFHRYGQAAQYLDELYQIESLSGVQENILNSLRTWKHWLVIEFRPIFFKVLVQEKSFADLWMSLIIILTRQFFALGRMAARLPEEANYIQTFQ
jgi:cellulose synthase/poly-beta-1,6-N-acetylglucosamine synthase-like glycosyltransferase